MGRTERWNQLGGPGVLLSNVSRDDLYLPFIRMSEETVYVRKDSEILYNLSDSPIDSVMHQYLCAHCFAHGHLSFIASDELWRRDLEFKLRARVAAVKTSLDGTMSIFSA